MNSPLLPDPPLFAMPLIQTRTASSPQEEWAAVKRLLHHHRLMLNWMIPSSWYAGPLSISVYSSITDPPGPFRTEDGYIHPHWVLSSTYLPETGRLRMAISGRVILCSSLKQAILKTADFLDFTSHNQDYSELPRYRISDRRNHTAQASDYSTEARHNHAQERRRT